MSRVKGQLKVKFIPGAPAWEPGTPQRWDAVAAAQEVSGVEEETTEVEPEAREGRHPARVQTWARTPLEPVSPCTAPENDEEGPSSLGFLPPDPLLAGDQGQEGD